MLSGVNVDIEFQGKTYHVQTEDGGLENPVIVTTLFEGGAILASRKTSYADRLKADNLSEIIRELIKEQHNAVVQDLTAGKFTGAPKTENQAVSEKEQQARKKTLDELVLDYLSTKENTDQ
jgi:ketol-acid reductoisomerase